jgi:predicted SAM-dependent methyltransferase
VPVADLRTSTSLKENKNNVLALCEEKKKLNLGSGTDIREEYVNIDIQSFPGIDIIADATNLSFIPDESIDYIVAQHLLEYVPRPLTIKTLNEWWRLLSFRSVLEIRVTDVGLLVKGLYLNQVSKEMGVHDEMVMSMLYGKQLDMYDIRYNGFTSEFLQGVLTGVGYRIIGVAHEDYDVIISAQRI